MDSEWITIGFYIILSVFMLSGLLFSIQAIRGKISWGQARIMGVSATLFLWVETIFYLVAFESAFGIVSLIIDLPLWVDFLIAFIVFLFILGIFIKLSRRATFKPALFLSLVLIPLGIPGVNIVAKVTKIGCVELTHKYGMYIVKNTDCKVDVAKKLWPQTKKTIIGEISFKNSHVKGRLGDRLSALRLTGMGYKKLNSKINTLHGIDGVYIKRKNGKINEILIVENKVDGSQLSYGPPKQMSDEWIIGNAHKMLSKENKSLQQTGKLIINAMNNNPVLIKKQLWKHDLETGDTSVKKIGKHGEVMETVKKWKDNLIPNELKKWCNKGRITCLDE